MKKLLLLALVLGFTSQAFALSINYTLSCSINQSAKRKSISLKVQEPMESPAQLVLELPDQVTITALGYLEAYDDSASKVSPRIYMTISRPGKGEVSVEGSAYKNVIAAKDFSIGDNTIAYATARLTGADVDNAKEVFMTECHINAKVSK